MTVPAFRLAAFMLLGIFYAEVSMAQDCKVFQIQDQYSSVTDYTVYERVKTVFKSNEVNDSSTARNAGLKAGIPVPVLDEILTMNFEGHYASSDWSHWSKDFFSSNFYESREQLKQSNLAQIFSNNSLAAVKSCLDKEPVYSYVTVPPDGNSFGVTISVSGAETLKGASINPKDAVSGCDTDNPFGMSAIERYVTNRSISGKKAAFSCGWNSAKSVHVILHLGNQGDRDILVPRIEKITVPPEPTYHTSTTAESYYTDGKGWSKIFGPLFTVCTPDKPAGWTIVSKQFVLTGDRNTCGSWTHCGGEEHDSPTHACRSFEMQGFEHGYHGGWAYTRGTLLVTWKHEEKDGSGK